MASEPSICPGCGHLGQYGFDGDWCHVMLNAALACPREGLDPEEFSRAADPR